MHNTWTEDDSGSACTTHVQRTTVVGAGNYRQNRTREVMSTSPPSVAVAPVSQSCGLEFPSEDP